MPLPAPQLVSRQESISAPLLTPGLQVCDGLVTAVRAPERRFKGSLTGVQAPGLRSQRDHAACCHEYQQSAASTAVTPIKIDLHPVMLDLCHAWCHIALPIDHGR